MSDEFSKKSTISIDVFLNEEKHPGRIKWNSTDNPEGTEDMECKAMLLSLFDKQHLDA